ncbi:hypothetical protein ACKFKF_03390 [Phormidesmis sp. 146-12]
MADDNKEKQQSDSSKIQVSLAVIALLGTLGTALVSNWDKIFSKPAVSPALQSGVSTPSVGASPSPASQMSGLFEVAAATAEGELFSNPLDKKVKIKFQAEGYWSANPGWKENSTSPEGYDAKFGGDALCDARASSLVMRNSVGDCLYIGKDATVNVAPKETLRFYINDVRGNYSDNKGFVKVKWSIEDQ